LFSIRSPRTAGRKPGGLRSLKIALLAGLVTVTAGALAAPAGASLGAVGPVNPRTGFADWYQDNNALQLQLCEDGLPVCSAAPGDLVAPDGEAFYWRGQGDLTSGTLKAKLALAQEAAFAPAPDLSPVAFGRVRVTITGALPNTTYTVQHPYGTLSITTDGGGIGKSTTDVGCAAGPCDWTAALGTAIGPFLHWDPTVAPFPPAGYIGDAATPHKVVGSPTGFNGFALSGGGVNLNTDLLTVEGKLAGPPVPDIEVTKSLGFGGTAVGAPLRRTITVQNLGVPDPGQGRSNLAFRGITIGGPQAAAFTLVGDTCSGRPLASGQACQLTVQMNAGVPGTYAATLGIGQNAFSGFSAVALTGSVAAPAPAGTGVLAGGSRSRLTIRRLHTTHRLSRARVLRNGLRLTMQLPAGTQIVKFSVLRVRNGKVNRKPVWLAFRVAPSRTTGLYRVRLDSRTLRRRLKTGLYQLNVTPGVSKQQLGQTSTTRIRVTRR
jgi:hypothetical protein